MRIDGIECLVCGRQFAKHLDVELIRCNKIFDMIRAQHKPMVLNGVYKE